MKNIYDEIATRIITELENGIVPWHQPWVTMGLDGAISHRNGKAYSLLNQIILGKPGEYLTYKECEREGGHVKKGAKASFVVFWKPIMVKETDDSGEEHSKQTFILKYFNVFHIDDCEGVSPKWTKTKLDNVEPIERAENTLRDYVKRSGVKLDIRQSDEAYYAPLGDRIVLPLMKQFESVEAFYGTAFHEATHSTGHASRLNRFRDNKAAGFGTQTYSKEELIAEIGSAAIMNELEIETKGTFDESVSYIDSWLKVLKNDKRFIVSAATKADKAVRMILGINDAEVSENEI